MKLLPQQLLKKLDMQKYGIDTSASTQRYGIDTNKKIADDNLALQNKKFDEQTRQYNQEYGMRKTLFDIAQDERDVSKKIAGNIVSNAAETERSNVQRESLLNQPNRQTPNSFVAQNFSEAGRQDVSVHNRGEDGSDEGPLGIGVNDNGTSYSRNRDGTFTHEDGTTVNFTDRDGKPGNAPTKDEAREKRMAERTAKYDDPTDDTATSGEKNVVCTEMYRQTQLDDWAQAMKMWSVYQRKYLTTTHQIGYHWLFNPFVRGMKVNRVLTTIGASLAKKRTPHLRHVLTKGKSKDSLVGNVFCKIIHPIVYLVGLAVHKK